MEKRRKRLVIPALLFALCGAGILGFDSTTAADWPTKGEAIDVAGKKISVEVTRPKAKKRYLIGTCVPQFSDPYWVAETYGKVKEAEAIGVDLINLSAGGYLNLDKQISQVEDLIERGVNAILFSPNSYEGTKAVVDAAVKRGIPVLYTAQESASTMALCSVITDHIKIGRLQAEYQLGKLGNKGKVVMLNGAPGASWAIERRKGYVDTIAAHPGMKILQENWGDCDRSYSMKVMEDWIQSFGAEIDAVYTGIDLLAKGAADAIGASKLNKNIIITGATFAPDAAPMVKSGKISMDIGESPVIIGVWAVRLAVRALNGETIPKKVFVPVPQITKDNIDKTDTSWQWAPEGWKVP